MKDSDDDQLYYTELFLDEDFRVCHFVVEACKAADSICTVVEPPEHTFGPQSSYIPKSQWSQG